MMPATWSPPRGLSPTPPEARRWLEQELHRSDYQSPWVDSVLRWLAEQLDRLLNGVQRVAGSELSPFVTILVALVVIALLVWVLPRVRRESVVSAANGPVLEDLTITAVFYRDRAAAALREGRYDEAVLDGFRAIARDMSDRTLLDDAPGLTAHEVSLALASPFPDHADRLARAADLFDSVRYGHRRADEDQAAEVRDLDTELAGHRPVLATSPLQDLPV
jgi:Domain of unknown function (DUF4129)